MIKENILSYFNQWFQSRRAVIGWKIIYRNRTRLSENVVFKNNRIDVFLNLKRSYVNTQYGEDFYNIIIIRVKFSVARTKKIVFS